MQCPVCGTVTKVIDSRSSGLITMRRRRCPQCNMAFTTYETHNRPIEKDLTQKPNKAQPVSKSKPTESMSQQIDRMFREKYKRHKGE